MIAAARRARARSDGAGVDGSISGLCSGSLDLAGNVAAADGFPALAGPPRCWRGRAPSVASRRNVTQLALHVAEEPWAFSHRGQLRSFGALGEVGGDLCRRGGEGRGRPGSFVGLEAGEIDRWGRLTRAWGFKWTPTALVGSIAHRQAA